MTTLGFQATRLIPQSRNGRAYSAVHLQQVQSRRSPLCRKRSMSPQAVFRAVSCAHRRNCDDFCHGGRGWPPLFTPAASRLILSPLWRQQYVIKQDAFALVKQGFETLSCQYSKRTHIGGVVTQGNAPDNEEDRDESSPLSSTGHSTGKHPTRECASHGGSSQRIFFQDERHTQFTESVQESTLEREHDGILRALNETERQAAQETRGGAENDKKRQDVGAKGYDARIASLMRGKLSKGAIDVVHSIDEVGVSPDISTLESAVDACCQAGNYLEATYWRRRMWKANLPPRWSAFRLEVEHCGRSGNWKRTLELRAELKKANVVPDEVGFNWMLDAFRKSTQWQLAFEILRDMKAAGWELTARSYRGVICSAAYAGACLKALDLVGVMQLSGVKPTSESSRIYGNVAFACATNGLWDQAVAVLEDMQTAGVNPSLRIYQKVIPLCQVVGEWRTALKLMDQLSAAGLGPDGHMYCSAISACGKAGYWQRAVDIFDDMRETGCRPDLFTYTAVISACGQTGFEWERVLRYLEEMVDSAIHLDDHAFSAIASVLDMAQEWEAAVPRLLAIACGDDGDGCGRHTDMYVVRLATRACGETKNWAGALGLVRELKRRGVHPGAHLYNCLILTLVPRHSYL